MKTKLFFSAMIFASMAIISCEGDKGELGPKGDSGTNGTNGTNGQNSLTKTTVEAAGANCTSGGVKIEVGVDANGNGALDASEVVAANTRYICNGSTGTNGTNGTNGQNSLTKTTVEAAGANCTSGGVKIEVGVDANGNGALDASEVVAAMTRFVCNGTTGTNGLNSLVQTSAEPAGANCTYGGTKFETGLDANRNGILDASEVIAAQTRYVCNGAGAIYSNWIDIDAEATGGGLVDEGQWSFKQLIAAPKLTSEIVDKGVVLMFLKNSEGVVSPIDRDDVRPIMDINSGASYGIYCGFTFRLNEVRFFMTSNIASGTGAEIRYVLIPGFTGARSVADLKKMSYEEVAKLYNIK